MIEGILLEGFIYGIMVLGAFISFRILNFADLTVDGSFPLGSAIMVVALLLLRLPSWRLLPGAARRGL